MPDSILTTDLTLQDSARPDPGTRPSDRLNLMLVLAITVQLAGTLLAFGIVRLFHLY